MTEGVTVGVISWSWWDRVNELYEVDVPLRPSTRGIGGSLAL